MSPEAIATGIGLVLTTIASVGVSVYMTLSKRKTERMAEQIKNRRESQGLSAKERRDAAAEAWAYCGKREAQHNADLQNVKLQLQAHRDELIELRRAERDSFARASSQEVQIKFQDELIKTLREENEELKGTLAKEGLRDRSDVHQILPPEEDDDDERRGPRGR